MGTGRFGGRGSTYAGARDAMEGSAAAPKRDMMHGGAHDREACDASGSALTPSEKTEFEGLKKKREHAGRLADHEQKRFETLRDKIGRIGFASAGAQRKRAGDRKACAA